MRTALNSCHNNQMHAAKLHDISRNVRGLGPSRTARSRCWSSLACGLKAEPSARIHRREDVATARGFTACGTP
ncbi:hypothetical protein [Variovorax sp. 160MFSha2.1]|uniref:hypothetical protein n=1 Tax=Variovorax sp. 160MFSha2.1 TaxID=3158367 RepID=UPI003AAF6DE1